MRLSSGARRQALELTSEYQKEITAVADQLLVADRLTGEELEAIIGDLRG